MNHFECFHAVDPIQISPAGWQVVSYLPFLTDMYESVCLPPTVKAGRGKCQFYPTASLDLRISRSFGAVVKFTVSFEVLGHIDPLSNFLLTSANGLHSALRTNGACCVLAPVSFQRTEYIGAQPHHDDLVQTS